MIDTPRTDAEEAKSFKGLCNISLAFDFARQLERELNACRQIDIDKEKEPLLAMIAAKDEALKMFVHADGCCCEAVFGMLDGAHPRHTNECVSVMEALSITPKQALAKRKGTK